MTFGNRQEAGKLLAIKLIKYKNKNSVVLALPRGGVVTGFEIAKLLGLPFDVLPVRKLGAPGNPELAFGAVAPDGIFFLDRLVIEALHIPQEEVEKIAVREINELSHRQLLYRRDKNPVSLKNKTVILVDDGIATGATAIAAIRSVRQQNAKKVVLAVPVCVHEIACGLKTIADDFVCLESPVKMSAVGSYYKDFKQVTNREVGALLRKSEKVV